MSGKIAKVLVTDDDDNLRLLYRGILERIVGVEVDFAANASECRALVATQCYQLALLDIDLGRESGLDLLEELHTKAPQTVAVMISSRDDEATVNSCAYRGATAFISKNHEFLTNFRTWVSHFAGKPAVIRSDAKDRTVQQDASLCSA